MSTAEEAGRSVQSLYGQSQQRHAVPVLSATQVTLAYGGETNVTPAYGGETYVTPTGSH